MIMGGFRRFDLIEFTCLMTDAQLSNVTFMTENCQIMQENCSIVNNITTEAIVDGSEQKFSEKEKEISPL